MKSLSIPTTNSTSKRMQHDMVNISINFMSRQTLTPSTLVLSVVLFGDLVPCAEVALQPSGLLVSSLSEMETWEDPQDPPLAAVCLSTLDTKTHTSSYINLQIMSYSWNFNPKHMTPLSSLLFNIFQCTIFVAPHGRKKQTNQQLILTTTCMLWRPLWCPISRWESLMWKLLLSNFLPQMEAADLLLVKSTR